MKKNMLLLAASACGLLVFSLPSGSRAQPGARLAPRSSLEIITAGSGERRVIWSSPERIEAPNWTHDGKRLIFTRGGRLYSVPVTGGDPEEIDTVKAKNCNSAHAISPDGTQIAFSDESRGGRSMIYVAPVEGGAPRRVVEEGSSYVHGWSPDGALLIYSSRRVGKALDIYTIPVAPGRESRENRLTYTADGPGINDAPEFTPDGALVYFHSDRGGAMQIWRMKADGKKQEQVTSDALENGFPHIAPDGKRMVFLSWTREGKGYPQDRDVMLRIMDLETNAVTDLAKLTGGLGTIDAPSWSPDSRQLAFVSYSPAKK